jgi:hypothetical protein
MIFKYQIDITLGCKHHGSTSEDAVNLKRNKQSLFEHKF